MLPNAGFWRGKRVLLTGHTGFKGSWLALWLHRLGAKVTAVSLPPATRPNLFTAANVAQICNDLTADIRDAAQLAEIVRRADPQIVLHLAAQALVRASYRDPLETFATNVMGTANLLNALRGMGEARAVVVATTDKVYSNREWAYPYREDDPLGGNDPYSASKAAAEIVIASYRAAFLQKQGVAVGTARAGNVIGGGDWSEDRLIPDAVRAWQSGTVLSIRSPQSTRPWQHVLEPAAAYLRLAECLWADPSKAGAYNFGPHTSDAATVGTVVGLARDSYGRGEWVSEAEPNAPHEAGWLTLEVARARVVLGVQPRWALQDAISRTMRWYRRFSDGENARSLCESDIADFEGQG